MAVYYIIGRVRGKFRIKTTVITAHRIPVEGAASLFLFLVKFSRSPEASSLLPVPWAARSPCRTASRGGPRRAWRRRHLGVMSPRTGKHSVGPKDYGVGEEEDKYKNNKFRS